MQNRLPFMIDLAIGSVWLLFLAHASLGEWHLNLFLILFPALRIWLSFMMHRRSTLMIAPIIMLSLMTIVALVAGNGATYALFVEPWIGLIKVVGGVLRGEVMQPTDYNDNTTNIGLTKLICGIWVILLPLGIYIYHLCKKQLHPTGMGRWKCIGLCLYIFAIVLVSTTISMSIDRPIIASLLLGIMVMLIPLIFNRGNFNGLFTRGEVTYMLTIAMMTIGYVCGLGLELKSAITVCILPAMMLTLAHWYAHSKATYSDILLIVVASVIFWIAQYTTHTLRITLLLASPLLMAVPVVRYAVNTRQPLRSTALYLMIAFIIPIFCLGYNPYSVLKAERKWHFDKYDYSPYGVLCIGNDEHWGLRDRYGVILPIEYDCIELLTHSKPYCKVRKEDKWQIYDIERHELVSNEWFDEVIPCNEYTYRLKCDTGDKYLIMPNYYHRYNGVQPAVISNEIPVSKEEYR